MKQLQLSFFAGSLALTTLLMYWQGVYYDYVQWDEGAYIVQNPRIYSLNLDNVYWMFTAIHAAVWAPVLWLSYAIDYQISSLNPFAYHLNNIILHTLNSIWIFFITLFLLKIKPIATFSTKHIHLAAAIAALLFAIHPQHVEPVMWIASRKDVLSLFFILATIWFYLHYSQSSAKIHYSLAVISFALAAMTKPIAMTIPVILLILDLFLLQRIITRKHFVRYVVLEKLPFWGLAILTASMAFYAHLVKDRIVDMTTLSLIERLFNAAEITMFYLTKFIIPINLSPYYPFPDKINIYPMIAFIILNSVLIYLYIKYKQSILLMVWLIFLISLFPTLNMITFNPEIAGADKFVYLPMVGFYILLGIGMVKLCQHCHQYLQLTAIIIVFMTMLSFINLSQQQRNIWKDNLHLWHAANQIYPNQIYIQDSLANAYFEHENYQAAIYYYRQIAAKNEICIRCDYGLANSYLQLGQLQIALHFFKKIIGQAETQAGLDDVYFKIALIQGRLGQFEQALKSAEKGISLNPNNELGQSLKQQLQYYYKFNESKR